MKLSTPYLITLPWRQDAAEFWFSSLSNNIWAILLHSNNSKHPNGRFDIITADPIGRIETCGKLTKVSLQKEISSYEDPLFILNKTLSDIGIKANYHPDFPFQGGAAGLFGYDLIRRFENLPKKINSDIFIPDMAIGIYDWAIIVDHHRKKVSLLSYNNPYARLYWIKSQHHTKKPNPFLLSNWLSNMTFNQYEKKFFQVQKHLQIGDCYQINLAQRFQANYTGDEWRIFCTLNKQNCSPFSAFLRLEQGVILSFSPERFINLRNGSIQTRPIKGTISRFVDPLKDHIQKMKLASSKKDIAENLMIVDLMRNDIGKVAKPGSVCVPELFKIEQFPNIYHLVSTITAKLSSEYNACDLLRATFPGGSITGAPKIRAMEIIDELEPHHRNAWCGSIGYLSLCGNMDTNINIRTLIAYKNRIYCYAGGGITVDSEVQSEYQETLDKVNLILKLTKNLN